MRLIEQNNTDEKLTFDDICIVPAPVSVISSRKQCEIYIKDSNNPCDKYDFVNTLPIFASPMGAVIDENNWTKFLELGICPVIPRTVKYEKRIELMKKTFVSFSMNEAEDIFIKNVNNQYNNEYEPCYICIDLAQGHMSKLLKIIQTIKDTYDQGVIIMSGNIANPDAYKEYALAKCDYVRCSVGTGFCCTTSTLTAVHYPPASLLQEISVIRENMLIEAFPNSRLKFPKIIADGGISSYADCIKAIACGADYAMIGRMFAQCIEACEPVFERLKDGSKFYSESLPEKFNKHFETYEDFPNNFYRIYYGMSTRYAQKKIAEARKDPNAKIEYRNAEGNVEEIQVTNTLKNWVNIFESSAKSTMSYCSIKDIRDLCNSRKIRVSVNAFMSYKKHTANK